MRAAASILHLHFGVSKDRKATSQIMELDSATCTARFPWSATKTAAALCCCASGPRSKITIAFSTATLYGRLWERYGFRSVCPKCRSSAKTERGSNLVEFTRRADVLATTAGIATCCGWLAATADQQRHASSPAGFTQQKLRRRPTSRPRQNFTMQGYRSNCTSPGR